MVKNPFEKLCRKIRSLSAWMLALIIPVFLIAACNFSDAEKRSYGQAPMDDDADFVAKSVELTLAARKPTIPPADSLTIIEPTENAVQLTLTPESQFETPETLSRTQAEIMLVVTDSGVWIVDEQARKAKQFNDHLLDFYWELNKGLSPDKSYFAYTTGLNDPSANPMLVVLDINNQTSVLQLELTGSIIRPGMEGTHGDSDFEAYGAMQYPDNLAWSPDGNKLAFVAARDGESADVYLFDRSVRSVVRLTDEDGHAAALHWSPDGQLLQYVSVNTFGTGAGSNMESLLVYNFQTEKMQILEALESNGENFLAWMDNSRFLINSFNRICGGLNNLRVVNAISSEQQVIVEEGFTAAAYNPDNQIGMFSIAHNYENCSSSEPLEIGLMVFGEGVPVLGFDGPIPGEIGRKKYEEVTAYGLAFIPQGNIFTLYGDEGLDNIYYEEDYGWYITLDIPPEVKGFVPYPSSTGDYWAWASREKPGLWVTENNSNPIELSPLFTGVPLWKEDGQSLYYYEFSRLFISSAPEFGGGTLVVEIPGQDILAIIK